MVGGHTAAAHRRAAVHGAGWYGFMLDRETTAKQIESLRREADAAGREPGTLAISVSPSEPLDPTVVRDYGELGVDRLVLVAPGAFWRPGASLPAFIDFVREHAPDRVGAEPLGQARRR